MTSAPIAASEPSPVSRPPPEDTPIPHFDQPTGGCACGRFRYRVTRPFLIVHACHCLHCQREVGGPYATNAIIEARYIERQPAAKAGESSTSVSEALKGLTVSETGADERGEEERGEKVEEDKDPVPPKVVLLPSPSGRGVSISHCPRCLTAVWANYGGSGPFRVFVRAGTLDKPRHAQPDVHIYTEAKHPGVRLPADGEEVDDGWGGKKRVRVFERYYDMKEVWSEETKDRWEEIKPDVEKWKREGGKMPGMRV